MSDNGTDLVLPVGRIVWGHPGKLRNKTDNNNNVVMGEDGQPVKQCAFGVAIPKDEFLATVWPAMNAEASKAFPNGAPGNFSWKWTDGDGVDSQGKPYSGREGYAGCYVLAISTELNPPGLFKLENGVYRQLQPEELKTGDFVQCGVNFRVNVPTNRTHKPGLYCNPLAVNFVGYGEEIQTGFQVDPMSMFGGQAPALPPGASAAPIAPAGGAQMPGMGAPPAQQPMQPQQPQMPAQQPMQPQQPQMPAQQPMQPQQPQMPPPATGFAAGAPQQPGMPGQQPQQPQMPGMPPPR